MRLLKAVRLFLKLLERIDAAFFETEFACTDKTSRTMPVESGNSLDRWVETVAMVARITTVAKQDTLWIIVGTACLASLNYLLVV
jgi:hypothetical protein